jgi:hypothetical protein
MDIYNVFLALFHPFLPSLYAATAAVAADESESM